MESCWIVWVGHCLFDWAVQCLSLLVVRCLLVGEDHRGHVEIRF